MFKKRRLTRSPLCSVLRLQSCTVAQRNPEIIRLAKLPLNVHILQHNYLFFTVLHHLIHCSSLRGGLSGAHNVRVNGGVFSFSSTVRLYHGCVWLRKGLVFLTYRDLDLVFFFLLFLPKLFQWKNVNARGAQLHFYASLETSHLWLMRW